MVGLLNYLPYLLITLGLFAVFIPKTAKWKIRLGVTMALVIILYGQLHQSYAPKGVVKKTPAVVSEMYDGPMHDRLSKPMSGDQRDEIRRKAYEEIDAKVEHLKP